MKYYNIKILGVSLIGFVPSILFAAESAEDRNLRDIAALIISYLNVGIALIIALAFVTFVWNVFRYFFTEKDKKEAGLYVMYSVIGFFVILSFWGIVAIVRNSLNLKDSAPPSVGIKLNNGLNNGDNFSNFQTGTNPGGVSGPH